MGQPMCSKGQNDAQEGQGRGGEHLQTECQHARGQGRTNCKAKLESNNFKLAKMPIDN